MTATVIDNPPARSAPRRVRRVLMLTHRLPYPPDRGDRIRSYNLVKVLAEHFELSIACTSEEPVWLQHHQLLSTMARHVMIQPTSNRQGQIRGVGALLTGRPITPAWNYRLGLADTVVQWHKQFQFDAVLTFCTGMIHYARLLTQPRNAPPGSPAPPRHVLDLVDVDSLKWASYARTTWPPMSWVYAAEARRLRKIEAGKFDRFDAVTVVSDNEAAAYREHVGEHPGLAVVPNGVDLDYFAPLDDADGSHTLVFVGVLNYRPNSEGIAWFVREVMPLLRQRLPDALLQIVGRHPTPKVLELGHQPGVEVVGSVPDVRSYLMGAGAVIAPLQIARGVQNKVLEAMACQRAVVCSTGAAQGLSATDGQHLLVARDPAQWADHLHTLLTQADHRRRIAAAARQYVQNHCSWTRALTPMVNLLAGEKII